MAENQETSNPFGNIYEAFVTLIKGGGDPLEGIKDGLDNLSNQFSFSTIQDSIRDGIRGALGVESVSTVYNTGRSDNGVQGGGELISANSTAEAPSGEMSQSAPDFSAMLPKGIVSITNVALDRAFKSFNGDSVALQTTAKSNDLSISQSAGGASLPS